MVWSMLLVGLGGNGKIAVEGGVLWLRVVCCSQPCCVFATGFL